MPGPQKRLLQTQQEKITQLQKRINEKQQKEKNAATIKKLQTKLKGPQKQPEKKK